MADNTIVEAVVTPGANLATDDIGGVAYPRSKIVIGADGVNNGDVSASNPLPVVSTSTAAKTAYSTSVAVAAGSQASLDSSQISVSTTGHLLMARASSSVPWRADLQKVENGAASSTLATWFWNDPQPLILPKNAVTVVYSATAGLDGFRLVVTNLDPSDTADLFAFFVWDEV